MNRKRLLLGRKITLEEKIAELQRELATRQRVYPEWVRNGRIKKDVADLRLFILEDILDDYQELLEKNRGQQADLFSG